MWLIKLLVVVLPWVPATRTLSYSWASAANTSER